jgi:hypothetical protein
VALYERRKGLHVVHASAEGRILIVFVDADEDCAFQCHVFLF